MRDEQFLADAKKLRIDVSPLPLATVQELVQKFYGTPKNVVERGRRAIRAVVRSPCRVYHSACGRGRRPEPTAPIAKLSSDATPQAAGGDLVVRARRCSSVSRLVRPELEMPFVPAKSLPASSPARSPPRSGPLPPRRKTIMPAGPSNSSWAATPVAATTSTPAPSPATLARHIPAIPPSWSRTCRAPARLRAGIYISTVAPQGRRQRRRADAAQSSARCSKTSR